MNFATLGTSFTKFGTSLKIFGIYLSYWKLYLITHDPFIPLGIFGKWLEIVPYFEMNFGTLGISLRKFDTSNPWANETPIPFPWSNSSFGDPWEVIRGRSPPWNGHWQPWYIIYKISHILHKIWYILKKIWYFQSLSYQDPYLITHGLVISLRIFGKWLEVVPYSETDFGTLGKFLRKFDTFNPWANGTPISLFMIHFFLWSPLGSDWRSFPTSEQTLVTLVYSLKILVYPSQNLVHP